MEVAFSLSKHSPERQITLLNQLTSQAGSLMQSIDFQNFIQGLLTTDLNQQLVETALQFIQCACNQSFTATVSQMFFTQTLQTIVFLLGKERYRQIASSIIRIIVKQQPFKYLSILSQMLNRLIRGKQMFPSFVQNSSLLRQDYMDNSFITEEQERQSKIKTLNDIIIQEKYAKQQPNQIDQKDTLFASHHQNMCPNMKDWWSSQVTQISTKTASLSPSIVVDCNTNLQSKLNSRLCQQNIDELLSKINAKNNSWLNQFQAIKQLFSRLQAQQKQLLQDNKVIILVISLLSERRNKISWRSMQIFRIMNANSIKIVNYWQNIKQVLRRDSTHAANVTECLLQYHPQLLLKICQLSYDISHKENRINMLIIILNKINAWNSQNLEDITIHRIIRVMAPYFRSSKDQTETESELIILELICKLKNINQKATLKALQSVSSQYLDRILILSERINGHSLFKRKSVSKQIIGGQQLQAKLANTLDSYLLKPSSISQLAQIVFLNYFQLTTTNYIKIIQLAELFTSHQTLLQIFILLQQLAKIPLSTFTDALVFKINNPKSDAHCELLLALANEALTAVFDQEKLHQRGLNLLNSIIQCFRTSKSANVRRKSIEIIMKINYNTSEIPKLKIQQVQFINKWKIAKCNKLLTK